MYTKNAAIGRAGYREKDRGQLYGNLAQLVRASGS